MALQMVVLAKLKLLSATHGCSSFVTALVWPFVLKLPFGRYMGISYTNLAAAVTLFAFRLGRIIFDDNPVAGNGWRWERALRLIRERGIAAQQFRTSQAQEDYLHSVSLVAL